MLILPLHFPSDISVALFVHRCPLGMSFFFHLWIPAFLSFICFFNSLISSMPVLVCLCQRTGEDSIEASATQQCNQRFTMRGRLKSHRKQNLKHTFLSAFPKPIMKTKYSFMHLCISENCLSQREKKIIHWSKHGLHLSLKINLFIMNALFSLASRCSQPWREANTTGENTEKDRKRKRGNRDTWLHHLTGKF